MGRARVLLLPLRVLQVSPYIHGLRVLVGGRSNLPRKGDFLISKLVWTNLVIKNYVLANIVTIAFVSVGGRRSRPSPPGPEWFREVKCRPSYGLTLLHWSFLQTCLHPLLTNGWHIYEDLMGLDEAWRMQGRQQATGRQGVKQLGRQDTRTGDSVRSILPKLLKIFYLETCSGQTWLSSTQSLSI